MLSRAKSHVVVCFVQLRDENVQKMYKVLDQQKSSYLTAFKEFYADVEAGYICTLHTDFYFTIHV